MRAWVRLKSIMVLVLMALISAPWPPMPSASWRSKHRPSTSPSRLTALQSLPVYSDFDGDRQPDQAELSSSGQHKSIHLSLSSSWVTDLTFDSATTDRGALLAVDIDHDNDLDLIWVSPNTSQPAVVWINDGRGKFERDTGSHAAELAVLLGSEADASVSHNQKVNHPRGAPTPSFPSDLALANKPEIGDLPRPSATGIEDHDDQAIHLTYVRKRGPPPVLS